MLFDEALDRLDEGVRPDRGTVHYSWTGVLLLRQSVYPIVTIRFLSRGYCIGQVPSIQQSAALALGRLANYSDDLAEAVVGNEILPQLVYSLSEQNRFDRVRDANVLQGTT